MGDGEIPEQGLNSIALLGDPGSGVAALEFAIAQSVQELVGVEGSLGDALHVQQPEAAVERRGARSGFLEDIGEGPVGHGLGGAARIADLVDDERGAVIAVMHRIRRRVRRAPFGVVQFQVRLGRGGDLLARVADLAIHGLNVRRKHGASVSGLVQVARRHCVVVGRDEIDGCLGLLAEGDGLWNPGVAGRGGATHAELGRNRLDGPSRIFIHLEIVRLVTGEEGALQVRLVPDLEVPAGDFGFAIALHPVLNQGADQAIPLLIVLGRRHVALPPEQRLGAAGQGLGHEAQFHERLDAHVQHRVVERIDVLPVVDGTAVLVLAVDAHVIAQQAVHAQIAEPAFLLDEGQLLLPVGPQSFVRASRANAEIEHAVHWALLLANIDADLARRGDSRRAPQDR